MYITDDDAIGFLLNAKENLVDPENSLIVVKENVNKDEFFLDKSDNSLVRTNEMFKHMFDTVGLTVIKQIFEPTLPKVRDSIEPFRTCTRSQSSYLRLKKLNLSYGSNVKI
jgi:hypothetical protein